MMDWLKDYETPESRKRNVRIWRIINIFAYIVVVFYILVAMIVFCVFAVLNIIPNCLFSVWNYIDTGVFETVAKHQQIEEGILKFKYRNNLIDKLLDPIDAEIKFLERYDADLGDYPVWKSLHGLKPHWQTSEILDKFIVYGDFDKSLVTNKKYFEAYPEYFL